MIDETPPPLRQHLRIHYTKGEAVKFISHHDEFRLWERALRRADLPLLYKQGFNPQPHMQFAAPLGVGITGVREPLDIVLAPPQPLDTVAARLRAKLPPSGSGVAAEMPASLKSAVFPAPRWPEESTIITGRSAETWSSSSIVGVRPSFSLRAA